jgi:hypothetical protein
MHFEHHDMSPTQSSRPGQMNTYLSLGTLFLLVVPHEVVSHLEICELGLVLRVTRGTYLIDSYWKRSPALQTAGDEGGDILLVRRRKAELAPLSVL